MKILFYYQDWNANTERQLQDTYGGIGYYRIVKVAEQIKDHDVTVVGVKLGVKGETQDQRWKRIFTEYDVFWTSYFSDPKEASAMFYWRDKLKKKVVIDLDDNYLGIVPSHPLYDKIKSTKKDRAFISTILSFADVITVSTEPLKQRIDEHMKTVYKLDKTIAVIPNFNDAQDWDYKISKKNKDKIVIGYSGSNSHQDDLEMVFPVIAKLMDKYPNLYFESTGGINNEMLWLFNCFSKSAMDRCDVLPSTFTFKEYPKYLLEQKWDIGICPLVDCEFTRSKSHIKWMEYSMAKFPVIASRVYPYFMDLQGRKTIENGVTGILVKPSEWKDALEDLINNPEKRATLANNAYNHIKENWQYKDSNINQTVCDFLK
jgi:glycosyltransferase involved in cell wall biosynthesis